MGESELPEKFGSLAAQSQSSSNRFIVSMQVVEVKEA
jgi:hypothetical protein